MLPAAVLKMDPKTFCAFYLTQMLNYLAVFDKEIHWAVLCHVLWGVRGSVCVLGFPLAVCTHVGAGDVMMVLGW